MPRSTYFLEYGPHVARLRRRTANAPAIHAASHVDHEKRDAWFSICMHACGSFSYSYGAPLGVSGRRSSAIKKNFAGKSTNQIVETGITLSKR